MSPVYLPRSFRLVSIVGLASFLAAACAEEQAVPQEDAGRGAETGPEDDLSQKPPQFVLLAFDGSKNNSFWAESRAFAKSVQVNGKQAVKFTYFVNPSYYLPDTEKQRYCGPKHACGKSDIGFGGTAADITARLEQTRLADAEGHEIASHAVGHFDGGTWTQPEWGTEFDAFDKLFFNNADGTPRAALDAVKARGIVGFRAPLLGYSAGLYPTMATRGFTYDTSKSNSAGYWPAKTDGIWNFPLAQLVLKNSGKKTLSMDYNHFFAHTKGVNDATRKAEFKKDVLDTYMAYFEANKAGNRAPVHIGHHFSKWNGGAYWEAMQAFAKTVCVQPGVQCVTYREFNAWLETRTPTQLADYRTKSFEAGPEESYCDAPVPSDCPHEDSDSHEDPAPDAEPTP